MRDLLGEGLNINYVVAALFALVLLYFLLRALAGPAKYIWRIAIMGMLGLVIIVITNSIGQFINVTLPINPFTVLLAGYLGVPGAAALVAIQLFLR